MGQKGTLTAAEWVTFSTGATHLLQQSRGKLDLEECGTLDPAEWSRLAASEWATLGAAEWVTFAAEERHTVLSAA